MFEVQFFWNYRHVATACDRKLICNSWLPNIEIETEIYCSLVNPLSTGGLSKIASFLSSLMGGPIKIL